MKFTILGSKGFIGSHLTQYFEKNGIEYETPNISDVFSMNLNNVIYCIGVADNKRPFDMVDAHTCLLSKILKNCNFESFLYLSSTRIYQNSTSTNEDDPISINLTKKDQIHNISKLLGEALCVNMNNENIRIARLSNVTGKSYSKFLLFVQWILRDAVDKGKIQLFSHLDSEKDYVYIDDVVEILPKISSSGRHKIYNVARGVNTPAREIVTELIRLTNCTLEVAEDARPYSFPPISIKRIKSEFNFEPSSIIDKLKDMVDDYKSFTKKNV